MGEGFLNSTGLGRINLLLFFSKLQGFCKVHCKYTIVVVVGVMNIPKSVGLKTYQPPTLQGHCAQSARS